VTCVWAEEDGGVHSASFLVGMLTVEPPISPDNPAYHKDSLGDAAFDRYMRHHCETEIYSFSEGGIECAE
jgi:hypothetical protein